MNHPEQSGEQEQKDPRIIIRVNVAGFTGRAASIFTVFNADTRAVVVSEEVDYEQHRREGALLVTNQSSDQVFDLLYGDDETRAAIEAYLATEGVGLLQFSSKVKRLSPANKIERDGMDASGMRYRISPDISNGQVAVLFACLAARQQQGVASMLDALDDFQAFTVM